MSQTDQNKEKLKSIFRPDYRSDKLFLRKGDPIVYKIPVYEYLSVYVLLQEGEDWFELTYKARKLSIEVDLPDFVDDLFYVGKKAVKERDALVISASILQRASAFASRQLLLERIIEKGVFYPLNPYSLLWVYHADEFNKTWICSTDEKKIYLYRIFKKYDRIKKTFALPPLWDIIQLHPDQRAYIFPDINGRPYVVVRWMVEGEKHTSLVLWWEWNKPIYKKYYSTLPIFSWFLPTILNLTPDPDFVYEKYGSVEMGPSAYLKRVSYISKDIAIHSGIPGRVSATFDEPLYVSGDLSLLRDGVKYNVFKFHKKGKDSGWYIFSSKLNRDTSEEIFILPFEPPKKMV